MDKKKIDDAWEVLKHEMSRPQFDSLTYWGGRLGKKGWKLDSVERAEENSIVLVLRDTSPLHHRHWFKIVENGEAAFMPTVMRVR